MRVFFKAAELKTLENIQKNLKYPEKLCSHFHFNKIGRLQPTIRLKPPLQRLAWKCSEKKRCSKISKIKKESLQNLSLFLLSYRCAS